MANVGKGHIERLPSGSYRVRVYAGTDPLTGKEIRLKATAKTAERAQAELARLLEQAAVGQQPESHATVGYLLDQYMAVADLDVSTRQGYEGYPPHDQACPPPAPCARSMPSCRVLSLPRCGGSG